MPLEGGTVQNDASNFPSHSAVARGMSNSDRNPGQVIDVNSVHMTAVAQPLALALALAVAEP